MNKISKKTGFSLLEVMVALSLLMITMSSTMAFMANNFNTITETKNKIIARYLAQEAIEYVRKVRDDNSFENPTDPNKWLENPLNQCQGASKCGIDVFTDNVGTCGSMNQCKVTYNNTTGKYSHDNNYPNTIFMREVNIDEIPLPSNTEAEITVTISWQHMGADRSFVLTEHIFNYKIITP